MPNILVKEDMPKAILMEVNGFIEVETQARMGSDTRPIKNTLTLQLLETTGGKPKEAIDDKTYNTDELLLIAKDDHKKAISAVKGSEAAAPLVSIPLPMLMEALGPYYIYNMRNVQVAKMVYRKLKLRVYKSRLIAGATVSAKFENLRSYENHSLTFLTGMRGTIVGMPPRTGAVSFSLYPLTVGETPAGQAGSFNSISSRVIDRPSRFLVRGSAIPPDKVFQSEAMQNLERMFVIGIPFGTGAAYCLLPVIQLLGDTVRVRAAQNMGYVKVAGQKYVEPGLIEQQEGGQH